VAWRKTRTQDQGLVRTVWNDVTVLNVGTWSFQCILPGMSGGEEMGS
jgi:hypothetical protein